MTNTTTRERTAGGPRTARSIGRFAARLLLACVLCLMGIPATAFAEVGREGGLATGIAVVPEYDAPADPADPLGPADPADPADPLDGIGGEDGEGGEDGSDLVGRGTWGTCDWHISGSGVLSIGEGAGASQGFGAASPWADYAGEIKRIRFEGGVTLVGSASRLFAGLTALECIDGDEDGLRNLKTTSWGSTGSRWSTVSEADEMFAGCTALRRVDLSGLALPGCSTLRGMFKGCTALEHADLSALATAFGDWDKNRSGIPGQPPRDLFGLLDGCTALGTLVTGDDWGQPTSGYSEGAGGTVDWCATFPVAMERAAENGGADGARAVQYPAGAKIPDGAATYRRVGEAGQPAPTLSIAPRPGAKPLLIGDEGVGHWAYPENVVFVEGLRPDAYFEFSPDAIFGQVVISTVDARGNVVEGDIGYASLDSYGYRCADWKAGSQGNRVDVSYGGSSATFYVNLGYATFTITYRCGDYGAFTRSARAGEVVALEACPYGREGEKFAGWAVAPSAERPDYRAGDLVRVERDMTLHACWERVVEFCSLAYDLNGAGPGRVVERVSRGAAVTLRECAYRVDGMEFAGWSTAPEGGDLLQPGDQLVVAGDMTLYAQWKAVAPETASVTVDLAGGVLPDGSAGPVRIEAEVGSVLALGGFAPRREGFDLHGWYDGDGALHAPASEVVVSGDMTLTAAWKLSGETRPTDTPTRTVMFDAGYDGANLVPWMSKIGVPSGSSIRLGAMGLTRPGYELVGWIDGATGAIFALGAEVTVNDDRGFTAAWKQVSPAERPAAVDDGSATGSGSEAGSADDGAAPAAVSPESGSGSGSGSQPAAQLGSESGSGSGSGSAAELGSQPGSQPELQPGSASSQPDAGEPVVQAAGEPAAQLSDGRDRVRILEGIADGFEKKTVSYAQLQLRSPSQTGTSVNLKWRKCAGAARYAVFGTELGQGGFTMLTTTEGGKFTVKSIGGTALKSGTRYKFTVIALDGSGDIVALSKGIKVATAGGAFTNAAGVKLASKRGGIRLVKGGTFKLKGRVVKTDPRLKLMQKGGVSYESANPQVATVSSAGVVKAKRPGTCFVYAYSQAGVYSRVKVTVVPKVR